MYGTNWNKALAPLERRCYQLQVRFYCFCSWPESRRNKLVYIFLSITTLHNSDQIKFSLGERLGCHIEIQKQTQYGLLTKMYINYLSLSSSAMRNYGLLLLSICWYLCVLRYQFMNAGSIIKLGLYNVSMDFVMMVLIWSTMKYDLEISTHISTLSVNEFFQRMRLLRPLCCTAWLSIFYPSQASRQVLE